MRLPSVLRHAAAVGLSPNGHRQTRADDPQQDIAQDAAEAFQEPVGGVRVFAWQQHLPEFDRQRGWPR
jgi:hypothetical protein